MMEQLQKRELQKALQSHQLISEDKKLVNLLELKLYDLSQNVEIMNRQLTNNQIKDIVSQTYLISSQLQPIYNKCRVPFLYHLQKKMQINFILLSEILTERVEKCQKPQSAEKDSDSKGMDNSLKKKNKTQLLYQIPQEGSTKVPILGGVHLYNQHYTRGLSRASQVEQEDGVIIQRNGSKSNTNNFVVSLMDQINTKAEVEVDSISEQVKNYILNFKECNKMANFISCQNELLEIIDFFKVSQLEALNFLNKSPHNNAQYTEDFMNRLTDLERDVKGKSITEKDLMLDKMKLFITRLRQKVAEIQKLYEQKSKKLLDYQKSLKKKCCQISTQTHDGYERKIKDFQYKIQQMEQEKSIFLEIRKAQNHYQSEINQLNHLVQLKINDNKKIQSVKKELEDELTHLKKIIRGKSQTPGAGEHPRRNKKIISPSETPTNKTKQLLAAEPQFDARIERFKRKYDKALSTSSNGNRPSYAIQYPRLPEIKASLSFLLQGDEQIQETDSGIRKMDSYDQKGHQQAKESSFKAEYRRNNTKKKTIQEDRQVSFKVTPSRKESFIGQEEDFVRERSISLSRSVISIEDRQEQIQQERYERRSTKNSTLKQKVQTPYTSIKYIEGEDIKKQTSKMSSKKCIILKQRQHKQKNAITTLLKITNFSINQQYSLSIAPINELKKLLQPRRSERPSNPSITAIKEKQTSQNQGKIGLKAMETIKAKGKLSRKKDAPKKGINNLNKTEVERAQSIKSISQLQQLKQPKSRNQLSQKRLDIPRPNKRHFPQVNHKKITHQQVGRNVTSIEEQKQETVMQQQINSAGMVKLIQESLKGYSKNSIHYLPRTVAENSKKISTNQFKQVAASLQLFRKMDEKENKKGPQTTEMKQLTEDEIIRVNNIVEELQKQNLSVEQFRQIMKHIVESEGEREIDNKLAPILGASIPFRNISKHENNKDATKFNFDSTNRATIIHQHKQEEHLINKSSIYQKLDYISQETPESIHQWSLKGISLQQISKIHSRFGKCTVANKDGKYCHHVHQFIKIINKIHSSQAANKIAMKLPIENIGQEGDHNEAHECFYKASRTQDLFANSYLKSVMTTEERANEQRQRLLPLIANTTSSYYKPKSKLK